MGESVEFEPEADKAKRTAIHQCIKTSFSRLGISASSRSPAGQEMIPWEGVASAECARYWGTGTARGYWGGSEMILEEHWGR